MNEAESLFFQNNVSLILELGVAKCISDVGHVASLAMDMYIFESPCLTILKKSSTPVPVTQFTF